MNPFKSEVENLACIIKRLLCFKGNECKPHRVVSREVELFVDVSFCCDYTDSVDLIIEKSCCVPSKVFLLTLSSCCSNAFGKAVNLKLLKRCCAPDNVNIKLTDTCCNNQPYILLSKKCCTLAEVSLALTNICCENSLGNITVNLSDPCCETNPDQVRLKILVKCCEIEMD